MSTNASAPSASFSFAESLAQERPRLTATGIIKSIGDPKTTNNGEGDYESVDIIFEPTRGSRKVFPKMLIRAEQFSRGFTPKMYLDYEKYPFLATIKPGKKLTLGETFAFMYGMHVYSGVNTNKKTGESWLKSVPSLVAICGGTIEGMNGFANAIGAKLSQVEASARVPGDFGLVELTPEEIVGVIREYIATQTPVEQTCILAQSKDENGYPKDGYEVALGGWEGPFSQELHDSLVRRAEKSKSKEEISKRLLIGYNV